MAMGNRWYPRMPRLWESDIMKKYNTTQLNPETTFERHVYHRDQFAHYLRWTYVLNLARIGQNVLDWGCGSGNLLEVFYRNRFKCKTYLGLEYKSTTVKKAQEKYKNVDWADFCQTDLCAPNVMTDREWDIIASFEVLEHIGKENAKTFLANIKQNMSKDTVLLLSTPNYNEKVGAAQNHIINGVVQEYKFDELTELLSEFFIIEEVYGTFASQAHYKDWVMDSPFKEFYLAAKEYYDSNMLSVIMAPVIPAEMARNCMWRLRKKV